jgi:hypothetical protein
VIFILRILTDAPSVFSGIAVLPARRMMMTLGTAEGLHREIKRQRAAELEDGRHQGPACRQK